MAARKPLRSLGRVITQDNHPDTRSRAPELIEPLAVRQLIQVCNQDARVIVVRPEGSVCCIPTHRKVRLESRVVELFDELPAMRDVRIDQQRPRIMLGKHLGLHGSTTAPNLSGPRNEPHSGTPGLLGPSHRYDHLNRLRSRHQRHLGQSRGDRCAERQVADGHHKEYT